MIKYASSLSAGDPIFWGLNTTDLIFVLLTAGQFQMNICKNLVVDFLYLAKKNYRIQMVIHLLLGFNYLVAI